MKVLERYLEEALSENAINENGISDDVKGLKKWLDDVERTHSYGNVKDAKAIIGNIIKRLNTIKKAL
jgi:hypothetical protein